MLQIIFIQIKVRCILLLSGQAKLLRFIASFKKSQQVNIPAAKRKRSEDTTAAVYASLSVDLINRLLLMQCRQTIVHIFQDSLATASDEFPKTVQSPRIFRKLKPRIASNIIKNPVNVHFCLMEWLHLLFFFHIRVKSGPI